MFCRRRRLRKIVAIMVLLIGGGLFTACHSSPEDRIDHVASHVAKKLDFNDQQKALLNDIATEAKKDFAEAQASRKAHFSDVSALLSADTLDVARVKSLMKEHQDLWNSKIDKYLEKAAALHKTLTPTQKKEIIQTMEEFRKHWD